MSIAYAKSVSPIDMQDGRRRAWKVGTDQFEVISRDTSERYRVDVVGGMPLCTCTAAHYSRACWHASLVLARIEREADGKAEVPEAEWMPCPDCEGLGYVRTKGVPEILWPQCERCEGKGEMPSNPFEGL